MDHLPAGGDLCSALGQEREGHELSSDSPSIKLRGRPCVWEIPGNRQDSGVADCTECIS